MQESLFSQGLTLLSYGMGTVFVFLAVLVMVTNCVSRVMVRFFPEPLEEPGVIKKPARAKTVVDGKTLKVIQAAIDLHRKKQNC